MNPRSREPLLALAFAISGCGSLHPSLAYHSTREVPRIPLRVDVEVAVHAPAAPADDDGASEIQPGDEALMADSLRQALLADLGTNGPFTVDADAPDAVLAVRVDVAERGDTTAWNSIPPWIWWMFGLPAYSRDMTVTAHGVLRHRATGVVLAEATARDDCTKYSGLYYNWSVTYECASEGAMVELREELARSNEAVAARAAALAGPRVITASTNMPQPPLNDRQVVAVFDVEDAGSWFQEGLTRQFTEYLATRIAEALPYRVVPREQLRARLNEQKAESMRPCHDEACQIELGKALAAQKSLATKVLQVGTTCALTTTLYDLRTETAERAASAKTDCSANGLLAGLDRVVAQLGQ